MKIQMVIVLYMLKTPWGSLIELQTIPNGYYYPEVVRQAYLFQTCEILTQEVKNNVK